MVGISLAPPARGGFNVSNLQALEDWLAHPVLSSGVVLINCVSFVASRCLRCLLVADLRHCFNYGYIWHCIGI